MNDDFDYCYIVQVDSNLIKVWIYLSTVSVVKSDP